jgi:hypothetical protein
VINESKLKEGVLILGGSVEPAVAPAQDFACQATNIRLTPSFSDSGDALETLCGDELAADTKTTWAMNGTSIQDFDDPDGFVYYALEHDGQKVPYLWKPNDNGASFTGNVNIRAVEIGGDVNTRVTSDFEWPLDGPPTVTKPAAEAPASAPVADTEPAPADTAPADTAPVLV